MSYSNDQTQIRAGLVNYLGALVKSSPFQDKAAKQNVASILVEETLKLAQDDEGLLDLYVLKPMLKGMVFILNQRRIELQKLPKTIAISEQIEKYNIVISSLNEIIAMV